MSESAPIAFPTIQSGIYRIGSPFNELYLELQRDGSLKAMALNTLSDAQKWQINPNDDGTYVIRCVWDNYELPCETYSAHRNAQAHHRIQLWTISPQGASFVIANAYDYRVLDLLVDNMVGFSDRNNVRGQPWVLHPIRFSDDTLSLRTKMAAMQPYSNAEVSDVDFSRRTAFGLHSESHLAEKPNARAEAKGCPPSSPLRVRKTPATQGVVREGIYRIASSIRKNDTVGFLELQDDNSIKVVSLNEASKGQQWVFTYNQNSKYYIKSSLNSRSLALRPSASDPTLKVPVGDDSFAVPWTVEPRHETYFIGVADDERVLDITENDIVVSENLNGCTTQRWDLDPVRFNYQPTFKEGTKYFIRSHTSGTAVMVMSGYIGYLSGDDHAGLHWTFKNQQDGGTAIRSVADQVWAAPELRTSTAEHSYRFIPAGVGGKCYFISPDMNSDPPTVMQYNRGNGQIILADFDEKSEAQMWDLVPKN